MGGWNIFYALLNFAIVALILYFVGKKMVVNTYKNHRQSIAEALEASKQAQERADSIRSGLDKSSKEGMKQAEDILTQAREQVLENSHTAGEKREEELALAGESSRENIRRKSEAVYRRLNSEMSQALASDAAAQIRSEENAPKRAQLVKKAIAELEDSLRPTASDMLHIESGEPFDVRVISADTLSDGDRQNIIALVERKFQQAKCRFDFAVDQSLVAGLCLEMGDSVYDASVRASLARLSHELESSSDPEAFVKEAEEKIAAFSPEANSYQTGRVISLSDGICRVSGLSDVMAGEMLAVS